MRPEGIRNPKSRSLRFKMWAVTKIMRLKGVPEPLRLFLARPKFAKASSITMKQMHRPESYWSVGARELMATHVSARFKCPF